MNLIQSFDNGAGGNLATGAEHGRIRMGSNRYSHYKLLGRIGHSVDLSGGASSSLDSGTISAKKYALGAIITNGANSSMSILSVKI